LRFDPIPVGHPLRRFLRPLTERAMGQLNLHDPDTIEYSTNLVIELFQSESVYRIRDKSGISLQYLHEIFVKASSEMPPALRHDYYNYKDIGDLTLFNLGFFPENCPKSASPENYAEAGRRSYTIVAEMNTSRQSALVYRKLSEQFEQCVFGLNWLKLYLNDPFYDYIFRELGSRIISCDEK
jgi:hypothetical protein